MDINQLEVLVTVAREKSFSRAAEVLDRTQPAVSQAIRRLENEVGEQLFDRSSKDGTLTQAGEVLLDYARQMLSLRHSAEDALREMRSLHSGRVSISANEHTVLCVLPVIAEFRKQYPLIKVEIRRGVASRIPKEITAREVELGVVSFVPSDKAIKSVPIMKDGLVLVVSPEHQLASRSSVAIAELAKEVFIAHNAASPYRQKVIETFDHYKVDLDIGIELPSLEAVKRLVETNIGVALVPRLTAAAEIAAGRLAGVNVNEMTLERDLHIIYRKNASLSHAAEEFLKMATEIGKEQRSSL